MIQYINNKISVAEVLDMGCPYDGCQGILSEEFIRSMVDEQNF